MLMKACFDFALDGAYDRFAEVARACGLFGVDSDAVTAAIDKMAADAEASGSPANTIKPVSQGDMRAMYRSLI